MFCLRCHPVDGCPKPEPPPGTGVADPDNPIMWSDIEGTWNGTAPQDGENVTIPGRKLHRVGSSSLGAGIVNSMI